MAGYEKMAQDLLASPHGAKVLKNLDKIKKLVGTPDGQEFLKLLSGGGGDALKKAAAEASTGDRDAAARMIQTLLSSPEGAKMASSLMEMFK